MTEVKIEKSHPQEMIQELAKRLRVKVQSNGAESFLNIPKRMGEGTIWGIDFLDGVGLLKFDCELKNDLLIYYNGGVKQPARFIFCIEGEFIHTLDPDNFRYKLMAMVGSIASSTNSNYQLFSIPPRRKVKYFSIEIEREKFYPKIEKEIDSIPEKLANVFKDLKNREHFLYQADYSLNISEGLTSISENEYEGMVRRIFLESKTLDLLWMQIKQYKDDINPISQQKVLRKVDLQLILTAKKILLADLKNPPDIKQLANQIGTNTTKLKQGFKKMFGKTVGTFIRDERLNKAKMLLAEENKSVKEIATELGYANKSAFSKRFKEKFGVLPSTFMKRYK